MKKEECGMKKRCQQVVDVIAVFCILPFAF